MCSLLPGAAYKLVCYFSNWAHNRPGPASVLPQDLDPFLCTHLIFAFASMRNNHIIAKNIQDEEIFYPEFNKLKERCVYIRFRVEFSDFTDVRELSLFVLFFLNFLLILPALASSQMQFRDIPNVRTLS